MPNGWRTINSLVHKIRLHGRRGKGMAESFSRQKSRHAPQKEGGLKILCDLPPVWPRQVRPTNLMSRMDGKKTHTPTQTNVLIFLYSRGSTLRTIFPNLVLLLSNVSRPTIIPGFTNNINTYHGQALDNAVQFTLHWSKPIRSMASLVSESCSSSPSSSRGPRSLASSMKSSCLVSRNWHHWKLLRLPENRKHKTHSTQHTRHSRRTRKGQATQISSPRQK